MHTGGPHFFFDFDSTIVTKESFDMVIDHALASAPDREPLMHAVDEITTAGMEGTLAFTESLQRRFEVVPLQRNDFTAVGQELCTRLTPGMAELFAELAEKQVSVFIISGGFMDSIMPVAQKLGVPADRVFTNSVDYDRNGKAVRIDTASVCYTDEGKAPVIEHIKQQYRLTGDTCMIGDGANDLRAYERGVADTFCGFTANVERHVIKEHAPHLAASVAELRAFIFSNNL